MDGAGDDGLSNHELSSDSGSEEIMDIELNAEMTVCNNSLETARTAQNVLRRRLDKKQRTQSPSGPQNVLRHRDSRTASNRLGIFNTDDDGATFLAGPAGPISERILHRSLVPRFNRDDFDDGSQIGEIVLGTSN